MRNTFSGALLCLIVGSVGIQSSYAYIPPSSFLIKNLAAKRKGLKNLKISSTVAGFDSGKPTGVHFKTVTIRRDYGKSIEVGSGLATNDRVIINPSDGLVDGDEVRIAKNPESGKPHEKS